MTNPESGQQPPWQPQHGAQYQQSEQRQQSWGEYPATQGAPPQRGNRAVLVIGGIVAAVALVAAVSVGAVILTGDDSGSDSDQDSRGGSQAAGPQDLTAACPLLSAESVSAETRATGLTATEIPLPDDALSEVALRCSYATERGTKVASLSVTVQEPGSCQSGSCIGNGTGTNEEPVSGVGDNAHYDTNLLAAIVAVQTIEDHPVVVVLTGPNRTTSPETLTPLVNQVFESIEG